MAKAVEQLETPLAGDVISSLPAWTRITRIQQLEVGAEYYVTWYCDAWRKQKNTIAEFHGDVNDSGKVAFEHSDIPWGTLEELQVFVAPCKSKSAVIDYQLTVSDIGK